MFTVEACKSNPCPNGATCIERELGFTCICPIKYHYIDGDNRCEQDIMDVWDWYMDDYKGQREKFKEDCSQLI
jgi:hypothetical protein